ncbi:MAG: reverse transcriptase domain-containing protein, partial [Bacteroidota bacterium]
IPKGKGKPRRLGIPTVVERRLQQAVSQVLMTKYEWNFESHSYGFRPEKNTQQAVLPALKNINDGSEDMLDLDVQGFFAEVDHRLLLQRIYKREKSPTTLGWIHKWLRAPIRIKGRMQQRRRGLPQGSPLSPLRSNILLDELDRSWKEKGGDTSVTPMTLACCMPSQKQKPAREATPFTSFFGTRWVYQSIGSSRVSADL